MMDSFIEHEGVVTNISDRIVSVSIVRNAACAGCQVKSSCVSVSDKKQTLRIPRLNTSSFKEGEKVRVKIRKRSAMKAIGYAFALPLFFLFLSIIITSQIGLNETVVALVAIGSLLVYYFFLYLFRNRIGGKFTFEIEQFGGET